MSAVVVVGFGRCGSTLVMTMLAAAGLPVVGAPPDFEVEAVDLAGVRDAAVKCLRPLQAEIPPDAVIVRLRRNPREQAKSQAKLIAAVGVPVDRAGRKALERSLRRGELALSRQLRGRPVLDLTFEDILRRPAVASESLARHVGIRLDAEALLIGRMVGTVIDRPAACRPNLVIERLLLQRASEGGLLDFGSEPTS